MDRLLTRTWTLEIPRAVRSMTKRPDVLLGLLQEDETLIPRCHPYAWVGRFPLKLSRAVLRPEICDLLPQITRGELEIPRRIKELAQEISSVIYVDDNRTNCRIENLRAITTQEVEASQGVQQ